MAHVLWRFISTTRVPCQDDFIGFRMHAHTKHRRMDQLLKLFRRCFFICQDSPDSLHGFVRIVTGAGF